MQTQGREWRKVSSKKPVKPGDNIIILPHYKPWRYRKARDKNLCFGVEYRGKEGRRLINLPPSHTPLFPSIDSFIPWRVNTSRIQQQHGILHLRPTQGASSVTRSRWASHWASLSQLDGLVVWGMRARQAQGFQPCQAHLQRLCPEMQSGRQVVL